MKSKKAENLTLIALFCAIICVSGQIVIPIFLIPITLQTFAIFIALQVLGGKRGILSILALVFLGSLGLPIFSSFRGGISAIFSPSGGYIIGFSAIGIVYFLAEKLKFTTTLLGKILSLLLGLSACYFIGILWFMFYSKSISFGVAIACNLFPFLPIDLVKLAISLPLSAKIKKIISKPKQ